MKRYTSSLVTLLVVATAPWAFGKPPQQEEFAKPPFTATPLGQPLPAGVPASTNAKTVPTKNSPIGGLPGLTRSQGTQLHKGVDDPSANPAEDVTRYTGTSIGFVVRSGPAYDMNGKYLGERVSIITANDDGVWMSTTMHHSRVLVTVGQTVNPGQEIAVGGGVGDQFKSPKAGGPHVHWELTRDGVPVNPLSGEPLPVPATKPSGSSKGAPRENPEGGHQHGSSRNSAPPHHHEPPAPQHEVVIP